MQGKSLPLNLRRLVYFHHPTAKEFAETIGTTERAVSAWLTGKRSPSYQTALRIAEVYGIDAAALEGDPVKFAGKLAHPPRIAHTEDAVPGALKKTRRAKLQAVPSGVSESG